MDRAGGQPLEAGAAEERILVDEFVGQSMEHIVGNVRLEPGHRVLPPSDAAQMRLEQRKIRAGPVHAREHVAHQCTVPRRRLNDGLTLEPGHDGSRLALDLREQCATAIFLRRRDRESAAGEMLHQFEVERQLLEREPLEDRQHVARLRRREEEVGVLDTRGDALQLGQFADGKLRQEARGFGASKRGENGHRVGPVD